MSLLLDERQKAFQFPERELIRQFIDLVYYILNVF